MTKAEIVNEIVTQIGLDKVVVLAVVWTQYKSM
jgi:hypothetical protein